jgi:serine/threonine protein phosphatase 1
MAICIAGDIHGCYRTFKALHEQVKKIYPNDIFVSVGDLIDRGPMSRQVIDYCIENNIQCVRGNHEQMFLDDVHITPFGVHVDFQDGIWYMNGGNTTLDSYKTFNKDHIDLEVLKQHKEWMFNLPHYREYKHCTNDRGQYLLVTHAAVTEVSLAGVINNQEILWNRQQAMKLKDRYNIFGHTPQCSWKNDVANPYITRYYANIDTGVYYKEGYLTMIRFPTMEIFQQKNIDFCYLEK